eukprot:1751318-Pyramimonas_sp.AAC.1
MRQNDLPRLDLREQPVGTWVDQIPPWTTLAKCWGTCKVNMDQCTTCLRDSHVGVDVKTDRDHGQPPPSAYNFTMCWQSSTRVGM